MLWFDWMTLAIVLGVAIFQTVRGKRSEGFGQPLFDALCLVVAALAAMFTSGPIAEMTGMKHWVVMLIIFVVLGIGAFIAGRFLFSVAEWSSESMDGILSFVFGLVCGWVIAHMVLRMIILSQGEIGPVSEAMPNTIIAREVYQFRLWNALMKVLFNGELGPQIDPNMG